jgi:thioredoxin 1
LISKGVTALAAALTIAALVAMVTLAGCRAAGTQAEAQPEAATTGQTVEQAYLGLSSGPLAKAAIGDLAGGVVLESGELSITRDEVDAFIEELAGNPEAVEGLRAEAFFVLEQIAIEQLLEQDAIQWAEEQGEGTDASIDTHLQHIAEKVTASDEDVREFYDRNAEMFGGATYEQISEQLRAMVLRERQQEAITTHIDGLSERREVVVDAGFLAEVAPNALDNPVDRARRSGKPTFVDFGAKGCYACDMMEPIIEELEAEFGDRVNVVLIQVDEEQYLTARYGVRSIPVQFIYDAEGREVFDHMGFLSKDAILEELAALGVD